MGLRATYCLAGLVSVSLKLSSPVMLITYIAEHVYEGNWVKAYLDHLYKNFFKDSGDVGCKDEVNAFGKTPISINTPDPKSATNYSEALMQNLGTIYTANERLALFSQEQNQKKNLVCP